MTTELSKDNWIVMLKGNVKLYIDEAQHQALIAAVSHGETGFTLVKGRLVSLQAILFTSPANEFDREEEDKDHKFRGDWKCSSGKWHDKKYDDCSCRSDVRTL